MDLLSRLLALMPVAGQLDARCHFGAPWRIDGAAAGEREIHYHVLLSGEASFEDGLGEPLVMQAGDIVMLPSGVGHVLHDGSGKRPAKSEERFVAGLEMVSNKGRGAPADVLCGRFLLPAMPQQLLRDHLPNRLLVRTSAAPGQDAAAGNRLTRLVGLMREESDELGPGSLALVNHLSGALFALTMRFASEAGEPPRGLLALAARPRLQPALSAMFDTPEKAWTLPELAELCHMSRATFARHFDEAIGRSASDMLTEIRMTIAGRMLAEGKLSVAEIGERVGYQSDAAFQRVFKRQIGVTPAQWRAQSRERVELAEVGEAA
ncbi:cupin domain-containing protein [Burkholderia gladioli]|uniref:AraC family transcriptional regulator n=1 Tax=Burkholderia gladioli TaxID=28095 RepID=A0AB38TN45_BURGA|nr:AraC family transcriptional regulator [Burkholderia gladioli]MBU9192867.1 AraC family transcriptional regulator [Burkholderia gladioli]MBU9278146.1 AraC family transcriptional regulator [Burkholderia gladioli]MBU9688204.1 AraC family transcriptional regulator [Burkholderia gladioli]MCA8172490.1 AraC family transcriptional regulator [Burkholderia gladioli]PRE21270.1 AraC family transcriptional regulator [Burkholderia gladioli]